MGEEISYDYLWKIAAEEKKTNKLLPLQKDFYKNADLFIAKLSNDEYDGRSKNIKLNTIKILKEFREKRKQKILVYAAYGRQLPPQTPENEKELYESVSRLAKAAIEPINKVEEQNILRSLKDMPEIILPTGRKIGPFTKNQELNVEDKEDAIFLINNEICENV